MRRVRVPAPGMKRGTCPEGNEQGGAGGRAGYLPWRSAGSSGLRIAPEASCPPVAASPLPAADPEQSPQCRTPTAPPIVPATQGARGAAHVPLVRAGSRSAGAVRLQDTHLYVMGREIIWMRDGCPACERQRYPRLLPGVALDRLGGGCRARSKAQDSGSCLAGVQGFKSPPPHSLGL